MVSPLRCEVRSSSSQPKGCVISLHGRGTSGEDLMPIADEMDLSKVRWIFPDAPFPCPGIPGGKMWFGTIGEGATGIETSRHLLVDLLDQVIQRNQIPAEKIALVGFSQGAVMGLDVGLRFQKKLGAIAALSGFLAFPEKLNSEKSSASEKVPILLVHGTQDEIVTVDGSRKARTTLSNEGYTVKHQEYEMGHQIIQEEIVLIRNYLSTALDLS